MIPVPEIDRLAGIECYCTTFKGTGGSIKRSSEAFRVSEIVENSLFDGVSTTHDERHQYPLYVMEKTGIDSNHALMEIERDYHIRLRIMGIKDAKAVARQYAGMGRPEKKPPSEIRTAHTSLRLQGFTRRPLGREFLAGNEFDIIISEASSPDLSDFLPQIENIGNFYGLQRFGSERLVTHLVGRQIVKRDFNQAVELLLSYTTQYDTATSKEIRTNSADPNNYGALLRTMPKRMDIERQVMSALVAGKSHIVALRAIPITIRRLFVQAYQSFIFNRCLSAAIQSGSDLIHPEMGDLCFEMEGPTTFGRIIKSENIAGDRLAVPAIRMPGYSFQPGKGRFENITNRILEQEGVIPKDFYIKEMQELSQQGGFRQAPLWCKDFSFRNAPQLALTFRLPKGSYATTLLRELIKPQDPIRSGF